jgi:hypothetical protein
MVAAAGEAGKTPRLQLVVAAAGVVTPQAHRRLLRLPVTVDSQQPQVRGSTFKESPGRLALVVATMRIWVAAVAAVRPQRRR